MPKKKSWFLRVREFFFQGSDQEQGKRNKKKRWLFRWIRTAKKPHSLTVPSLSRERAERRQQQEQQDNQVLPEASRSRNEEEYEPSIAKIQLSHAQLVQSHSRCIEDFAAVKIQTLFRGYLARKALKALKGLVRLQAIIRGRAVRRQTVATLKCLQSIVSIQSQVCSTRYQMVQEERKSTGHSKYVQDLEYQRLKLELQSQRRRRDDSLITKDEENALLLSKTEVMMRRNRTKAYSFSHRLSAEIEDGRTNGRLRHWLEQHMGEQVPQKEEIKRVDTIGGKQLRLRNTTTKMKEDRFYSTPAYMAATESARARARSTGSPRLRPTHLDSYSDGDSPYKRRISPMSSINSERTCSGGGGVAVVGSCKQRPSPRLKGIGAKDNSSLH